MKVLMTGYNYAGLVKGFEDLGWEVLHGDEISWWPRCWNNLSHIRAMGPIAYGQHLRQIVDREKPDLICLGKNFDTNAPSTETKPASWWTIRDEDLRYFRSRGVLLCYLSLDDPDALSFALGSLIPQNVDMVGTCCIETAPYYKRYAEVEVFEFWPAWDQVERQPVLDPKPDVDFMLVGTPYSAPNSEFGIPRREIARRAIEMGLRVEIYGPGWLDPVQGGDETFAPYYKGVADFNELHLLFSRAKLTYNSFLRRGYRYLNDRVPIAAGGGSFLLMEHQNGLPEEFVDGVMVAYHGYRDLRSFEEVLTYWLKDDACRTAAAKQMQAYVLKNHTYRSRAETIHKTYESLRARRS